MINISTITDAVYDLLKNNLSAGVVVKRNSARNMEYGEAVKGWVNVVKNSCSYEPKTTGFYFRAKPKIDVEIQMAWMASDTAAEDKLASFENEVMTILKANPKLGGTVNMTMGYEVTYYEIPGTEPGSRFEAAIITILTEVDAS